MPKKIPGTEDIEIKQGFKERYKRLLKKDYDKFIDYSLSFLRRSIRINTLKSSVKEIKERLKENWKLTQIPWCKEGFWIEGKRRDVGNLLEHQLGYIYIQEAVSMIPPLVLEPKPEERILDMCASPGSKTTQIAQYMKNKGMLIANDYKGIRLSPLGMNIQRCGITNTVITLSLGQAFKNMTFDKILVDAPCSGTGTIRKSLKTLRIWNPYMIKRLAGIQINLLENAFNLVKENGIVVYSTCTLEPLENEAVVSYLLDKHENAKLEEINIDIKKSNPIMEFENVKFNDEVKKCLRIWPQDNDTEGFFVAKIKKV